jgi:hypothetical protein
VPSCIDYFWDRVSLYPQLAWITNLPFVLSHIAGVTGVQHSTQPLVKMGSCELFALAGLQPRCSWSLPPELSRITDLSHHAWPFFCLTLWYHLYTIQFTHRNCRIQSVFRIFGVMQPSPVNFRVSSSPCKETGAHHSMPPSLHSDYWPSSCLYGFTCSGLS